MSKGKEKNTKRPAKLHKDVGKANEMTTTPPTPDDVLSNMPKAVKERVDEKRDSPLVYPEFVNTDEGLRMQYKGCEHAGLVALIDCLGIPDWPFARQQLASLGNTSKAEGDTLDDTGMKATGDFAAISSIAPKDAVESMLAVQMVATHRAVMKSLAQLNTGTGHNDCNNYANRAAKLMNVYTRQIEALNKHRTKGKQKMTVEHVHVNEGGQAIIGNVEGGGNVKK